MRPAQLLFDFDINPTAGEGTDDAHEDRVTDDATAGTPDDGPQERLARWIAAELWESGKPEVIDDDGAPYVQLPLSDDWRPEVHPPAPMDHILIWHLLPPEDEDPDNPLMGTISLPAVRLVEQLRDAIETATGGAVTLPGAATARRQARPMRAAS